MSPPRFFAAGVELGRPRFYLETRTPALNDLNSRLMNDIESIWSANIASELSSLSICRKVQPASSSQVFSPEKGNPIKELLIYEIITVYANGKQ